MRPIWEAVIFQMLLHKAGGTVFSYFGKMRVALPPLYELLYCCDLWNKKWILPTHWKTSHLSLQMKSFQINDSKKSQVLKTPNNILISLRKQYWKKWQLFHESISPHVGHAKFQKISETVGKYFITCFMVNKLITSINVWLRSFFFFGNALHALQKYWLKVLSTKTGRISFHDFIDNEHGLSSNWTQESRPLSWNKWQKCVYLKIVSYLCLRHGLEMKTLCCKLVITPFPF